jgi:hypothetical protein
VYAFSAKVFHSFGRGVVIIELFNHKSEKKRVIHHLLLNYMLETTRKRVAVKTKTRKPQEINSISRQVVLAVI